MKPCASGRPHKENAGLRSPACYSEEVRSLVTLAFSKIMPCGTYDSNVQSPKLLTCSYPSTLSANTQALVADEVQISSVSCRKAGCPEGIGAREYFFIVWIPRSPRVAQTAGGRRLRGIAAGISLGRGISVVCHRGSARLRPGCTAEAGATHPRRLRAGSGPGAAPGPRGSGLP